MRIAEISTNFGRGGPGGVMKDITECALENGHECRVYYGRGTVPDGIDSERIGSTISVYAHALKARAFDCAGFSSKAATKGLIRSLERYRPDVIHLHNLLGYYLDIRSLFGYLKKCGVPVVWTLHDCWAFTGHCITFERADCTKWQTGCFSCPLKKDYPESYLFDRSHNNYRLKSEYIGGFKELNLVTPSRWLHDLVKQSFLKQHACSVIHNGIDTEVFKPTASDLRDKYRIGDKTLLLAVAGVWNEMKGIGLLAKIAEKLGNSYQVVVIGDSDKYSLPQKVIRIPRTENREQLVQWYSAADMLINPTFGDNFPTVNIEALASGTPVVTNLTGGSGEAAGNRFGRTVVSKSADEFIEKIAECRLEQYRPEDIRAFALQYDRKVCTNQYLELFSELTGEN